MYLFLCILCKIFFGFSVWLLVLGDGHRFSIFSRLTSEPHHLCSSNIAESGRPGRAQLLAKKGRIVGGVGCPPNCRTSGKLRGSSGEAPGKLGEAPGKLRGSSDPLELFRKMLHFGKLPKKIG